MKIKTASIKDALALVNSVGVAGEHANYILMTIKNGKGKLQLFPAKYAEATFEADAGSEAEFYLERALITPWLNALDSDELAMEIKPGEGKVIENTDGLKITSGKRKLFLSGPADPMKILRPKSGKETELSAIYGAELVSLFPSMSRAVIDASTNPSLACIYAEDKYLYLRGPNFYARRVMPEAIPAPYAFPLEIAPHLNNGVAVSTASNYTRMASPNGYVYVPIDPATARFPVDAIRTALETLKGQPEILVKAKILSDVLGRLCGFLSSEKVPAKIHITGVKDKPLIKLVSKVQGERVVFEESLKLKQPAPPNFSLTFAAQQLVEVLNTLPGDETISINRAKDSADVYWTSDSFELAVATSK